jgi:branched-chain amino acid transport system ATP-binding protein
MSILEINAVSKRFGGLRALDDVNLNVAEHSIHAIIGPNGAGKSTLLNCLVGKLKPDAGSVRFMGKSLIGLKAHQINQLGVSRVFQTPEIFGELSVFENVLIPCFAKRDGAFSLNGWRGVLGEKDMHEKAEQMLVDVSMQDARGMTAASLSRGDKRRLEMAMCLAQDPKLLLLDEPTAGMSRADTNNTIDLLKQIQSSRNITKVVIEHDMHVVFSLAETISVMAQGTVIAEGSPVEIKGHPKVREAYLGTAAQEEA